ncbi:MAG: aldo/keto reductase [Microbacteriaceae bacterium]|nr:aldo/keto reductase [Microbacteriaceae bacterium]
MSENQPQKLAIPEISLPGGRGIPQLGVGTYKLESADCERVVAAAFEMGYRHIDTAKLYENEAAVGAAFAASGLARDEVWITTKLWHDEHDDAIGALGRSLDRLGLDSVDLYLVHWPVPALGTAWQAWQELISAREAGLARNIGVSNFEIEHLERIISETGVVPAVNQIELHPHHQRRELVEFCREKGIAVEAWSPLARGRESLFAAEAVVAAAQAHGRTPAQILLRWHVQSGFIVFPKTSSVARLAENAAIFEFELSADEMAALNALECGQASGRDPREFNGF